MKWVLTLALFTVLVIVVAVCLSMSLRTNHAQSHATVDSHPAQESKSQTAFEPPTPTRVAIVITGRLNTDVNQYNNFRDTYLQDHGIHVDIFASSSIDPNANLTAFRALYHPVAVAQNGVPYFSLEAYQDQVRPPTVPHRCLSMYVNRTKAADLLASSLAPYAMVVATRCDLYMHQPFDWHEAIKQAKEHGLIIPNEDLDYSGISDQFAYGTNEKIIRYLKAYDRLEELLEAKVPLHPEMLLAAYLKAEDITPFRNKLDFHINRDCYQLTPNHSIDRLGVEQVFADVDKFVEKFP